VCRGLEAKLSLIVFFYFLEVGGGGPGPGGGFLWVVSPKSAAPHPYSLCMEAAAPS
jgi:hypothetical protein